MDHQVMDFGAVAAVLLCLPKTGLAIKGNEAQLPTQKEFLKALLVLILTGLNGFRDAKGGYIYFLCNNYCYQTRLEI
jgi:hypothetical protein